MKSERMRQRVRASREFKQSAASLRQCKCAVCGWQMPVVLTAWTDRAHNVLTVHHVVPVAAGGSDEESNLVILCPNHHAIAHRLAYRTRKRHYGPKTPAALVEEMRLIERDPVRWDTERQATAEQMSMLVAALVESAVDGAA